MLLQLCCFIGECCSVWCVHAQVYVRVCACVSLCVLNLYCSCLCAYVQVDGLIRYFHPILHMYTVEFEL